MGEYIWELDFKTFSEKVRTINFPQYCDRESGSFRNKRMQIGCDYYIYIDKDLKFITPYTKKDGDKKLLKSFRSTFSREDVLRQAYNWILVYARENELYSPNDRFSLTFDVMLKNGGYDRQIEVGAYFPYNGNDRAYFNAVRDERYSNGLDMREVIFYSQKLI